MARLTWGEWRRELIGRLSRETRSKAQTVPQATVRPAAKFHSSSNLPTADVDPQSTTSLPSNSVFARGLGQTEIVAISPPETWSEFDAQSFAATQRDWLTADSRKVQAGGVFVAVKGERADGHDFIPDVVQRQAAGAVIFEREPNAGWAKDRGTPWLQVRSTRRALAWGSALLQGEPSRELFAVAVTGTNGKTTSTYLIESVLQDLGWPCGVMGTVDHHLGQKVWPSALTTPDAPGFQARLREFVESGARAVSFEASSHALDQSRLDGVEPDVAVITNLTRDHLDYHGDMDRYFAAKARLFGELLAQSSKANRVAIWNGEDAELAAREKPWREMALAMGIDFWSLGRELRAEIQSADLRGTDWLAHTPFGNIELHLPLPGAHNLANAMGALGVAIAAQRSQHSQVDLSAIAQAMRNARAPRGRLERVPSREGRHVFVDYAHTDDAIRSVMGQIARVAGAQRPRLILVFGCGGDRDRGKRPLMMKAACETSDLVVLTSDNPRSEDPQQIIDEAYRGRSSQTPVHREIDRRAAIRWALSQSRPGDVVVIAGKGHERTQEIAGVKYEFDDVVVATEELRELESRKEA